MYNILTLHLDKDCPHYDKCVAAMIMEMLARAGDRTLNSVKDCSTCNMPK